MIHLWKSPLQVLVLSYLANVPVESSIFSFCCSCWFTAIFFNYGTKLSVSTEPLTLTLSCSRNYYVALFFSVRVDFMGQRSWSGLARVDTLMSSWDCVVPVSWEQPQRYKSPYPELKLWIIDGTMSTLSHFSMFLPFLVWTRGYSVHVSTSSARQKQFFSVTTFASQSANLLASWHKVIFKIVWLVTPSTSVLLIATCRNIIGTHNVVKGRETKWNGDRKTSSDLAERERDTIKMDQILNKVGSYWLGKKANKQLDSVGDDINVLLSLYSFH